MEMTTLGKTQLKVSRLGTGLAEIGSLTDVSMAGQVLDAALDGGITFFDTAACYGKSEEWIGRTIAHRRHQVVLATKVGHIIDGDQGQAWTAATIRSSIERSLKRMRTDYLDLAQLHSCSIEILERGEIIQMLLDAKQAGKTHSIGYSGGLKEARWVINSDLFDTIQITFNLVDQWARWELLAEAEAAGMGIIAKRPIANAAWGAALYSDPVRKEYWHKAQAMLDMGPIPQAPQDSILLSLGFVLAHREIDTAIVGTANPQHVEANIALVENELPIPAEVVDELHRRFDQLARLW